MADFAPLTACGQMWRLQYVDKRFRDRFSAWAAAQASLVLAAQKEFLPAEIYQDRMANLSMDAAAGSYRWGTRSQKNAMGRGLTSLLEMEEGMVQLLAALLEKEHKGLSFERVREIYKDNEDMTAAAIKEAIHGPNESTREESRMETNATPSTTTPSPTTTLA